MTEETPRKNKGGRPRKFTPEQQKAKKRIWNKVNYAKDKNNRKPATCSPVALTSETWKFKKKVYPWYFAPFEYEGVFYDPEPYKEFRDLYDKFTDSSTSQDEKDTIFDYLCDNSPAWYIHNCLNIIDKCGEEIRFDKWNTGQKLMYQAFARNWFFKKAVRMIVLKARQVGSSTFWCAMGFWYTTRRKNRHAVCMCHVERTSKLLLGMVDRYYRCLPDTFPPEKIPEVSSRTAKEIEFGAKKRVSIAKGKKATDSDNGGLILDSKYRILTAAGQPERGGTIQFLHSSEVCEWKNDVENWNALYQAVPPSRKAPETIVVMESTAIPGTLFEDLWNKAKKGENEFDPVFIGWTTLPDYEEPCEFKNEREKEDFIVLMDKHEKALYESGVSLDKINWRRKIGLPQNANGDLNKFMQEFPANPSEAFSSSSASVYSPEAIKHAKERCNDSKWSTPVNICNFELDPTGMLSLVERSDGNTRIWREPEEGRSYVIGADPSEGGGGDDFSIQVLEVKPDGFLEQAAHCYCNRNMEYMAKQVYCLAQYYGDCLVVPEANAAGAYLTKFLQDEMCVDNLYMRETYDGSEAATYSRKVGFYTTPKSKELMINRLISLFNEKKLLLHCKRTVDQFSTFIRLSNGKKYGPNKTTLHDDAHSAIGLAVVGAFSEQMKWNNKSPLKTLGNLILDAKRAYSEGRYQDVPSSIEHYVRDDTHIDPDIGFVEW